MTYSEVKLESNGDKASSCFRSFWIRYSSDKFYICRLYCRFHLKMFNQPNYIHEYTKFNKNIVQCFSSDWVIGLLEIFTQLIYCPLYFHFSPVSVKYRIFDEYYVKTSTDHLPMELSLRQEYWIKFRMKLVAVIFLYNYYGQFYHPFYE